ncbi:MAG TPA: type II and III secretion system protein family protein [Telluria sp.]|nr:type II and III secretion system protein family protein [Telluria sp.]
MSLIAAMLLSAAAAAPAPSEARAETGPHCAGRQGPPARLPLELGKSTLMRLPEPAAQRSVGNPSVVQAILVAPDTMYVVGVDIGSTNMIIQGRSGMCSIVDVVVSLDAGALQAALAQAMPDEKDIHVLAASDSVVLTGTVADGAAVARAGELAAAFVRRPVHSLLRRGDEGAPEGGATAAGGGMARVVNMLNVNAPQQVMLEVKVAEVSRTLLERMEASTHLALSGGGWLAALTSNFLSGTPGASLALSKGKQSARLDAQTQDALVRILAEPTVMAISGQEGSFLAGGKFYIPVQQDNNKITLAEKEFGVSLRFTPTVMAGGRINLQVAPEVSELSREGIGVSATGGLQLNAVLPVLTTRRASTTVQLADGQSFAIGGLIKNSTVGKIKGLPILGELPVLGALFRSTDFEQDKTELVFVVTAHLVRPLAANLPLPTDKVGASTRSGMILRGRVEEPAPAAPSAQSPSGFELR